MNIGGIATSARRGIIWIGKYAPFFIVTIVTLSNIETMYSILAEKYATFDGMVVYYKPISWWIGERFELSIAWIVALFVLSFGVEACVWNRACIAFLAVVLWQKDFFLEHTINETHFICIVLINIIIGVILVHKGLRIFIKSKCKNK